MARLNDKAARTLPGPAPGKSDAVHWDSDLPGFGLRILASGRRAWQVRYRVGKKQRVVRLGTVEERNAADARREAQRILGQRHSGVDERTAIERRKAEASKPKAFTFGELVESYLAHAQTEQRPRTYRESERYLKKLAAPLHSIGADALTRKQAVGLLEAVAKASGLVAHNRMRSALMACYAWGLRQGKVETENPVANTVKHEERPRERVLRPEELRVIWLATGDNGDHSRIVRLLMLTGVRRQEAGGMRWREVELDRGDWTILSERTKNGRSHMVPMSDPVVALLEAVARREERDLVFGRGQGGFSGWSLAKKRLDERLNEVAAWTLHDLRRTVSTGMHDELGITPHIVEAVLNHVSGHQAGVAGVYNKAVYLKEKREALTLWARWLMKVVQADAP